MEQSFLSREEEVELAHSNKKVKDVHHVDFTLNQGLVGAIPGAYNQAFELDGYTDDDDEVSNDDVAELREGVATVSLSKDVKQRIKLVWVNSLIVKVYGRNVRFHFLKDKLFSLWKPFGKLDIIDLGKDFFLVKFGTRSDYVVVLENGPWFIGEHFLSIRPWELNFKPSTVNVASIAVWVRLAELPIEYYEMEVLKHIGRSISNVLRIDTHTATESRGCFARLCVQVDIEKPFVTSIIIGGLEQPVMH
nr:hypothetical protein CFP56_05781 [Quercus suber]